MRKSMIAGNWKMNNVISESIELVDRIKGGIGSNNGIDIVVCPPYTALSSVGENLKGSAIALGAQNVYFEKNGAYTGEVSIDMLKDCACKYIIIGHSERRQIFEESDALLNKKLKIVMASGMTAIFCVGETLKEREEDKTFTVIDTQISKGFEGVDLKEDTNIIIAYEPVWAIGTGKTATPEQAQEVHKYIRGKLAEKYGSSVAENIRILYGGSVKPDNISDLIKQDDIDGALVGGASLKADSFVQIIQGTK